MGIKIVSSDASPVSLAWERNGSPAEPALAPELAGRDFLLGLAGVDSMDPAERAALVSLDRNIRRLGGLLVLHSFTPALLDQFHEEGLGADLIGAEDEAGGRRLAEKFHELTTQGGLPMPREGYALMLNQFDPQYRRLVKLFPPPPLDRKAEMEAITQGPTRPFEEAIAAVESALGLQDA